MVQKGSGNAPPQLSGIIHRYYTLEPCNRLTTTKKISFEVLTTLRLGKSYPFCTLHLRYKWLAQATFPCVNHYIAEMNRPLGLSGLGLILNTVQFDSSWSASLTCFLQIWVSRLIQSLISFPVNAGSTVVHNAYVRVSAALRTHGNVLWSRDHSFKGRRATRSQGEH